MAQKAVYICSISAPRTEGTVAVVRMCVLEALRTLLKALSRLCFSAEEQCGRGMSVAVGATAF